MIDDLNV